MRIALGLAYNGRSYHGWQSQPDGQTVQDRLEQALHQFVGTPVGTICAGRTDSGVHAALQVVHFDTPVVREPVSWVRGTNRYLPADIAVQWARPVSDDFHARNRARSRRYVYVLLQSPVRPSLEAGRVGWSFLPLDATAMRQAARHLLGRQDFTSFRAAACQALSPVKTMRCVAINATLARDGHGPSDSGPARLPSRYWRFEFEADAFLHHMIRNIMGCLIAIGQGQQPPQWMEQVLQARSRDAAAPTFAPDGLYFLGPCYDSSWGLPTTTSLIDSLPGGLLEPREHQACMTP